MGGVGIEVGIGGFGGGAGGFRDVLDEAANTPTRWLPGVASTCAGIGLLLVTIWQSKAQIDAAYGRLADSVITNHGTKIIFSGVSDPATLDYAGRLLGDEDILTHVILPAPGNVRTGHYEVRYKQSHDWPLAFTTVVLAMNGNTIRSARVVLGAVAPVPWRSKPAEDALAGKPLNEQTAAAAGEAAVSEAKPMSGNAYKVQIAKTAVKRAIMNAAGLKTA